MIEWQATFQTLRAISAFPRPVVIASESRRDTTYHLVGRRRTEPYLVFQYTLSGSGVFKNASGASDVPPGSGFLCEVSAKDIEYFYPAGADEPWIFVYFSFAGPTAVEMVREMVNRYGPIYRLDPGGETIRRLTSFEAFDGVARPLSAGDGARMVMNLLAALADSAHAELTVASGSMMVQNALQLIEDNLCTTMNVSDLADRLRISREHLTRVFAEHTGQPPYSYMLRRKMLLACRLLKHSSLTVGEITARLGYDQPSRLTRVFKSTIGMTPSQFRRTGDIPFA